MESVETAKENPEKVEEKVNPVFAKKSQNKQIETLLAALKRERNKVSEQNIKLEVIMNEFKSKVRLNQ